MRSSEIRQNRSDPPTSRICGARVCNNPTHTEKIILPYCQRFSKGICYECKQGASQ